MKSYGFECEYNIDCYYKVGSRCKFHEFSPCDEKMECEDINARDQEMEMLTDKIFDECNLIGNDVNIYEIIKKHITNVNDEELEKIYDEISERLGFTR